MDPKYLMQLAVIVELGSVTKAARKLNVTQPTLSRTIRIIEDRVGGNVLRRGRYGVAPTEIGQRLADEGRAIIRHADQAQAALQEWRQGLSGELRIGMGPMLAASLMADFLAGFVADPPGYSLKLSTELPPVLTESLRTDRVDIAIIPHELSRPEEGLHREPLLRDDLSVFVGAGDPLAGQTGIDPRALAQHHWITVGDRAGLFDVTRATLDALGLTDVTPWIENSGDVTVTFRMLATARACTVLPLRQATRIAERVGIAPVGVSAPLPSRDVGFWTTATGRDRPEVVDFLNRLRRFLDAEGLA
jgi:DNA-binding transcriptional LysR family regulator